MRLSGENCRSRGCCAVLAPVAKRTQALSCSFFDNASKSMALRSKEIYAKLVFALTPDPYRSMVDANGVILCFQVEMTLEKLNQITIGDALLAMTDGIEGIGGESVKSEMKFHFPQLQQAHDPSCLRMIMEAFAQTSTRGATMFVSLSRIIR